MRTRALCGFSTLSFLLLAASNSHAAPQLRLQVDQRGNFALIGNTIAQECGPGVPAPVVGDVGACGTVGINDTAPDVFWRADSPSAGLATAGTQITLAQARTTAVLALPADAKVTHAWLYWAATRSTPGADTDVTIERPSVSSTTVTASGYSLAPGNAYQSRADVTAIVQQLGVGAYRVGGIDSQTPINADNADLFGGWWMVVLYELASEPPRNLAIFDGLDRVSTSTPQTASLTGFVVPDAGFDARLGLIAFEGDNSISGDRFFFNPSDPVNPPVSEALGNAQNPADNFFNSTRSWAGVPVSTVGDLPQLTGTAASMSGVDLDVLDVTSKLTAGTTNVAVRASSTGDVYLLGGFVTAISTYKPDLTATLKRWRDVTGGSVIPGDLIEYVIEVRNTGNDTATGVRLTDVLPAGVTLVAGSMQYSKGVNSGSKTDAAGDDQAEYDAATRTLTARMGTGADASQPGTLAPGAETWLSFLVKVDPDSPTTISNQAVVRAAGLQGAPAADIPTDGNGADPGVPATTFLVDKCATDADCSAPTGHCDVSQSPRVCVGCLENAHCIGLTPVCSAAKSCAPCASDADCTDAAHPVCATSGALQGACVECSASSAALCAGTKPLCIAEAGICGCTDVDGDSECGDAASGMICNGVAGTCVPGCSLASGRNGCPATSTCSEQFGNVGVCLSDPCVIDANCTTTPLLKCNTVFEPNRCVQCLADGDCTSPQICDEAVTGNCVECTSQRLDNCAAAANGAFCLDNGTCGCTADSHCGSADSGRVCDSALSKCTIGCRGDGNGCPTGFVCSSSDDQIGQCAAEPDAGPDGAAGQGGAAGAPGSGGSSGSQDAGTGGSSGKGGSTGAGGSTNKGGSAGSPASGGAAGSSGKGGANADAGQAQVDLGDGVEGGGCSCQTPGGATTQTWGVLAASIALLFARARRRRG